MSKNVSSKPLSRVTSFIVNVYAPLWFKMKSESDCQSGARNFFYLKNSAKSNGDGIRVFDKNKNVLNLAAKSYLDMIDWNQSNVTPQGTDYF